MMEADAHAQLVKDAWLGDAVLSLYAREKILREDGVLNGAKAVRLTSNQFLGTIGEPTKVEAEVGRIYVRAGLAEAFRFIDEHLLPVFARQEENRLRRLGGGRKAERG